MVTHTQVRTTTRIGKATSKESSRYAIQGAKVEPAGSEHVRLIATNGRVLALVKESGHTDKEYIIPTAVIPTQKVGGNITGNGQWQNDKGKFTALHDEDSNFPPYRDVIPNNPEDYDISIAIDAQLLLDLAQAIGGHEQGRTDTTINLAINTKDHTTNKAIMVVGKGIGVIMPVNMNLDKHSTVAAEFTERKNEILSDD